MPAPKPDNAKRVFQTRSHAWAQVGLAAQLSQQAARDAAKRAWRQVIIVGPLIAGVLIVYAHRDEIFGRSLSTPVRIATVIALVILGWAFARDVGRVFSPLLFRRMDPGTAGTVGFLIRLVTMAVAIAWASRIAGLTPRTLALGGAFTAVIIGLAAQQTFGNLIAGAVLISARPFRVGERVRLVGGTVGGVPVEGTVSSIGLFYTSIAAGRESVMIPNNVVLGSTIAPLNEPDSVDLRARLRADIVPSELQALLERSVTVETRTPPSIALEEVDGDEVLVRITATPRTPEQGATLADEILAAVAGAGGGADAAADGDGTTASASASQPARR